MSFLQTLLRDAKARLRSENYRCTPQREVILELLVRHSRNHFTAEEIHQWLRGEHPHLGLSTVYRTLTVLEHVGLIRRLDVGDGVARYEFDEDDSAPHCHLVCVRCGEVRDIACPAPQEMQGLLEAESFHVMDYSMSFFGLCGQCSEHANGNAREESVRGDVSGRRSGEATG